MSEIEILSAKARKKYIETGGTGCPFCESPDIEGGSVDIENREAYQEIACHACGQSWLDVYALSGIIPGRHSSWRHEESN